MKNYCLDNFQKLATPFYFYDLNLLRQTLNSMHQATDGYPYKVHYALKANSNPRILREIARVGLGADLVSGGELKLGLETGFPAREMAFAGVGKSDEEILLGLSAGIGCFNVESIPELEVINALAQEHGKVAPIALRVNPDIDAHTHKYITTGTSANKFGIALEDLPRVVEMAQAMKGINLRGLHFHIGSQLTLMKPYELLCAKINELQDEFEARGVKFEIINVGGGLGIDYLTPDEHPIADFDSFFSIFKQHLQVRPGQEIHFELGRSIVAQCGSLIARVLYVKENRNKKFVILDAGMTHLMRPALYGAVHSIENLSATGRDGDKEHFDVVGPICESSDVFAHDYQLPPTRRGDLVALRSAGAYGETMASTYNSRALPGSYFSET